jgi:hypothetical protein
VRPVKVRYVDGVANVIEKSVFIRAPPKSCRWAREYLEFFVTLHSGVLVYLPSMPFSACAGEEAVQPHTLQTGQSNCSNVDGTATLWLRKISNLL